MTHDSRITPEFSEIDANYEFSVSGAQHQAEIEKEKLRREITRYRNVPSFDEIQNALVRKYDSISIEELVSKGICISREDFIKDNKLSLVSQDVKETRWRNYVSERKLDTLRKELVEEKGKHLMYKALNESQIDEMVELYGEYIYKSKLLMIQENVLGNTKYAKDTYFVHKNLERVSEVADASLLIGEAKVTATTELEKKRKEENRKILKDAFSTLVAELTIPQAIYYIRPLIIDKSLFELDAARNIYCAVYIAAAFALLGVRDFKNFNKTPKAVETAKKLGIYDAILELEEAKMKYEQYISRFTNQEELDEYTQRIGIR